MEETKITTEEEIDVEEGEILDEDTDSQTASSEVIVPVQQSSENTTDSKTSGSSPKTNSAQIDRKRANSSVSEREDKKKLRMKYVESIDEDETILISGGSLQEHTEPPAQLEYEEFGEFEENEPFGPGVRHLKGGKVRKVKGCVMEDVPEDKVCVFFLKGNCNRGSECPFIHAYNKPTKLEPCRFHIKDRCSKKDRCQFMHHDFPCKFYHTGRVCYSGRQCKFTHRKLSKTQQEILRKFLRRHNEPDTLIDSTEMGDKNGAHKLRTDKIPSLFDIEVSIPEEFKTNQNTDAYEQRAGNDFYVMGEPSGKDDTTPVASPESGFNDELEETVESKSGHRKKNKKDSTKRKSKRHKSDDSETRRLEKKLKKLKKQIKRDKKNDVQKYDFPEHLIDDKSPAVPEEDKRTFEALARLPKRQQELYLRIQQHQKEVEVEEDTQPTKDNEETNDADDNWYSSDEEPPPSLNVASILDKLKASSVPSESSVENKTGESSSLNMFDLTNIHISDDVSKLLTTIRMQTQNETDEKPVWGDIASIDEPTIDDSSIQDIDVTNMPFQPITIHETANEIEASITSHPPLEYKLIPIDYTCERDYTDLAVSGKIHELDPRLKLCKGIDLKKALPPKVTNRSPKRDISSAASKLPAPETVLSSGNMLTRGVTIPVTSNTFPGAVPLAPGSYVPSIAPEVYPKIQNHRKVLLPDPVIQDHRKILLPDPVISSPITAQFADVRDPRLVYRPGAMPLSDLMQHSADLDTRNELIPEYVHLNIDIRNVPPPVIEKPLVKSADPRLRCKK